MKTLKNILVASITSLFVLTSANAGELSISGSMEAAATQVGGEQSGNKLGLENELAVTGSTELDNGIGVSYKQTITGAMGFNDAELMFTTDYGTVGVSSTGGTIEDIDNIVPTAFEEAEALWPTASGDFDDIGINDGTYGILYKNALLNTGMNISAYYTGVAASGDSGTDDAVTGGVGSYGSSYSVYLRGNPLGLIDGVDLAIGYENADRKNTDTGYTDVESATVGLNYTYGPLKVGAQIGAKDLGLGTTASGTNWYKNTMLGAAYAVNDAFSISYTETKSQRNTKAAAGSATVDGSESSSVATEASSYSATYTMGGLTIAYVDTDVDNAEYTLSRKRSASQIVLTVAF